jgi:hypothetical protein
LAPKTLPNATKIHDLDAPGGGKRVTFPDSEDNFLFHLVYKQELVEVSAYLPELDYSSPKSKPRPVNKTQRFKKGLDQFTSWAILDAALRISQKASSSIHLGST